MIVAFFDTRLSGAVEEHFEGNLFVGSHNLDDIMQQMIEHAQCIAFWVSAEILSCTSAKVFKLSGPF